MNTADAKASVSSYLKKAHLNFITILFKTNSPISGNFILERIILNINHTIPVI